jgi:hypothetical protein
MPRPPRRPLTGAHDATPANAVRSGSGSESSVLRPGDRARARVAWRRPRGDRVRVRQRGTATESRRPRNRARTSDSHRFGWRRSGRPMNPRNGRDRTNSSSTCRRGAWASPAAVARSPSASSTDFVGSTTPTSLPRKVSEMLALLDEASTLDSDDRDQCHGRARS